MATEIYDNLDPKKSGQLDARLTTVANVAALPDLTVAANFLYEGATIYVTAEKADYQAQFTVLSPAQIVWVSLAAVELVQGAVNIVPTTNNLDLSLVTPAIATCESVVVTVVGGTSATINSITNWPAGQRITFNSAIGQEITYTHTDYDASGVGDIVSEDGQSITIIGRTVGNDSLTLELNGGVTLVQWDATQFLKLSEVQQGLLNIIVEDSLTSQSTSTALSANQGYILNGLIDDKQATLVAGDHIAISTGNVISALPWDWLKDDQTGQTLDTGLDGYIVSAYGSTAVSNYRYVKQDQTQYILPAKLNPSTLSNWIQISDGVLRTQIARYNIFFESPNTNLSGVTGNFHPAIDINSGVGDVIPVTWGGDAGNYKYSIAFAELGLYKIEFRTKHSDENILLTLYRTDDVTTPAAPLGGAPVTLDTSTLRGELTLSAIQEVSALDNQNGFVVEMTPTAGWGAGVGDYQAIPGWVEITKIR